MPACTLLHPQEKLQLANAELAAAQHNLGGCEEELRAKQAEQRDLERKLQKLRDSQTCVGCAGGHCRRVAFPVSARNATLRHWFTSRFT